ncbi:MAG: tetratricopeptide repeat protein [Planctomycetota bacterium]
MAKTLAQYATDIHTYLGKGKVKAARKALDKAIKGGAIKGGFAETGLDELDVEVRLAEGDGAGAAEILKRLAADPANGLKRTIKSTDAELRGKPADHPARDVLWEVALAREEFDVACRHAAEVVDGGAVDSGVRAKALLNRKDAVGATGIFLLASLGAIKTDRIKLADRLLENDAGARLLQGVVESLHKAGREDGPIHYSLAQFAKRGGDKQAFIEFAGKAFEENPDEVWTWTESHAAPTDLLEIAARKKSLTHLLRAARKAEPDAIIGVAQRAESGGTTGGALRAIAVLMQGKLLNACRILEKTVADDPASAAPLADAFTDKRDDWDGARVVLAAVLAAAGSDDAKAMGRACDALVQASDDRGEPWIRVADRLVGFAPARDDLRSELGLVRLRSGDAQAAADLLQTERHLEIASGWMGSGEFAGEDAALVLRRAAALAEETEAVADHADWILSAAKSDPDLLAELGRSLSGGASVSVDTALTSANALADRGGSKEAAAILAELPLSPEAGTAVHDFLRERDWADADEFSTVAFRNALARGDTAAARRLFERASGNVQALTREAARHPDPARVLAEVLIDQGKGEVVAPLLEERRKAGDKPGVLLPLVDSLLKKSPKLAMARLLRGRLLHSMKRDRDAVRDLCTLGKGSGASDAAFELLGQMLDGNAAGPASLGRADILLSRGEEAEAVDELRRSTATPAERLARFDTICEKNPGLDSGQSGRAQVLREMKRYADAAGAQLARFRCGDADRRAVAADVESLTKEALEADDLDSVERLLTTLADEVSDGAERATAVIAADQRAPMLVLRARLFLELDRPEEAVATLSDLVRVDSGSRQRASDALRSIVDSGRARPDADFALAEAHRVGGDTPGALTALRRLYDDDITEKENVLRAAADVVRGGDDPDVRMFLAHIAIDVRDPAGATEHAVHARRMRPDARRDVITLLRRALDLDAFAADTHFALAEAHLAGDEADDAVRHLRAAVEVARDRAGDAIRVMEEAADRSKHAAHLYLAIGTTYAEFQRDHKRAVTAFTSGLEAKPPAELKVSLLLGRGDAYAALRADDQAYDDFDEASHLDRLERRYYEFLRVSHRKRVASLAEAAREKAKAEGGFEHAVEACGRFIRLDAMDDAVSVAQLALAASPGDLGARYLVGVALHAAARYDAAVQVLEAVRQQLGADSEIGRAARMLLAESYLDRGDRTDARACLTEIESVDADYPGLRARRAAMAPPADDPQAPPPLFVRPAFPRPTE